MARTNKTEYAVLGLLNMEPMSGYDIKGHLSGSVSFFWKESYGQLYPTLRKLLEGGYVTRKIVAQDKRPDRHIYRITKKGRRKLQDWLSADIEPSPVRVELLLKLYFGTQVDQSVSIRHVEDMLNQQENRLRVFTQIEKEVFPPLKDMPEYKYWLSTLRYGKHISKARVKWCREALSWLRKE